VRSWGIGPERGVGNKGEVGDQNSISWGPGKGLETTAERVSFLWGQNAPVLAEPRGGKRSMSLTQNKEVFEKPGRKWFQVGNGLKKQESNPKSEKLQRSSSVGRSLGKTTSRWCVKNENRYKGGKKRSFLGKKKGEKQGKEPMQQEHGNQKKKKKGRKGATGLKRKHFPKRGLTCSLCLSVRGRNRETEEEAGGERGSNGMGGGGGGRGGWSRSHCGSERQD